MLPLLILVWHLSEEATGFLKLYLRWMKGQNPISENKFEKQILLLLHAFPHAALPILLAGVMLCSYIAWPLAQNPSVQLCEFRTRNMSSKYHLYSFFCILLTILGQAEFLAWRPTKKTLKATGDRAAGAERTPFLVSHIPHCCGALQSCRNNFLNETTKVPWIISQNMLARFQFEYSYAFSWTEYNYLK